MSDYIKRQDAIDAVMWKSFPGEIESALKKIPSANVVKARCVELENICKYINKEFGSDCPICIQIRNENGSLKEADYVVDFCNDKSGVLYLMNHKFKNGSCE